MKVSDYIANFLAIKGVRHAFVFQGGASAHMIDSIAKHPSIKHICCLHEQANAFAADGNARATGNVGVAISTSGPGATNMLTGVIASYYDSVPMLFLTGQVCTFRSGEGMAVRQLGFQETNTVDIYRSVTKYAIRITDKNSIRYELEKAYYIATTGRKGPVLLDIPDDIQREDVDEKELPPYHKKLSTFDFPKKSMFPPTRDFAIFIPWLKRAKKPVIIAGAGLKGFNTAARVAMLSRNVGIPIIPTWGAVGMFRSDKPLYVGTAGTHGTRCGNFALANADLILALGTRLDLRMTGSPAKDFAPNAKKIVVDIDKAELDKFEGQGLKIDLPIHCSVEDFLTGIEGKLTQLATYPWLEQIKGWKEKYPIVKEEYYDESSVNPYCLAAAIGDNLSPNDSVVIDTGCTLAWMMQGMEHKRYNRVYHDWNTTAMGWALPAAIGVSFATKVGSRYGSVVCIVGDGALQLNIQELATIAHHQLPIKIIVLNNGGYGMIRQTQNQWFERRYIASLVESSSSFNEQDLPDTDFFEIAKAYEINAHYVERGVDLVDNLENFMEYKTPALIDISINRRQEVSPVVRYGKPNYDMEPLLSREELASNLDREK